MLFCIVTLFIQCEANANTFTPKSGWKKSFLFGYGIANADQSQIVHSADTPLPGLDNGYVGSSKLNGSIMLGLALDKEFLTSYKNTIASAGIEIDYLRNQSVNGIVEPMVNVSPDFDILKYFYDIHSLVFQATGKYTTEEIRQNLNGYIQAGIGAAINRLSDYREYAPGDSSASPMLSPYGNKDTFSPAFSAGIGATYQLTQFDAYLSIGYRYFYTGRGRLMKSPVQQTNASITLSPISYQFIVLTLTM